MIFNYLSNFQLRIYSMDKIASDANITCRDIKFVTDKSVDLSHCFLTYEYDTGVNIFQVITAITVLFTCLQQTVNKIINCCQFLSFIVILNICCYCSHYFCSRIIKRKWPKTEPAIRENLVEKTQKHDLASNYNFNAVILV
jgi:hypothetical protein